jgi:hypothetical protein
MSSPSSNFHVVGLWVLVKALLWQVGLPVADAFLSSTRFGAPSLAGAPFQNPEELGVVTAGRRYLWLRENNPLHSQQRCLVVRDDRVENDLPESFHKSQEEDDEMVHRQTIHASFDNPSLSRQAFASMVASVAACTTTFGEWAVPVSQAFEGGVGGLGQLQVNCAKHQVTCT